MVEFLAIMSVSAVHLTQISPEREIAPSFSLPSRLVENTWKAFVEIIRVDRTVVNLVQGSLKDRVWAINSVVLLFMTGAAAYVLGPLFGTYMLAINILFLGGFKTVQEFSSFDTWIERIKERVFPLSTAVKNLIIGAAVSLPLIYLVDYASELCVLALEHLGVVFTTTQDVALLISSPALGIFFGFLGVVVAPIAEEILFRKLINDYFLLARNDEKNPSQNQLSITELRENKAFSTWDKAVTILKTSLIFAAVHLSPFQSWANIPIFLGTFLMGLCAGVLREVTGDLWAPAIFHGLNNARAFYQIRFA